MTTMTNSPNNVEVKASAWTDEDRELAHKLGCQIFVTSTTKEHIDSTQHEWPTDVHIVEYIIDGEVFLDAARAYKMVDIFNAFYDKLSRRGRDHGVEWKIVSIRCGYGKVKPKLWNYRAKHSNSGS